MLKPTKRSIQKTDIRNMKSIYIYYGKELHTERPSNELLINGYKVKEKIK
jgi:hypothetical protein